MGFEVHCATNFENETMIADAKQILEELGVVLHQIDIRRSPFQLAKNANAYNQLKKLMRREHFAGVHCHTPMGGMIGRLAAQAAGVKPVLYTAHGFHFYKGCPLQNRLIYENVERFLARYTDAQLTINQEDYTAARAFPLRGRAYYIHGIGVDVKAMDALQVDRNQLRYELGIPTDAFLFVSVGEINKNKNHETAIRAFAKANIENAYYIICGTGPKQAEVQELIEKLGVKEKVKLLGFRKDAKKILKISDCFVFPSYREGLSVALMEAMAAGLPCVVSEIRGNTDLIKDGVGGFLLNNEPDLYAEAMDKLVLNPMQMKAMGKENRKTMDQFSIENVRNEMMAIYEDVLNLKPGSAQE